MDFPGVSCDAMPRKNRGESEARGMKDNVLEVLKVSVVELVEACEDEDLLDLLWKLLLGSGVKG